MVVIFLDSFMAASFWIHLLSLRLTGCIAGTEYIEKKKRWLAGALFGMAADMVVLLLLFDIFSKHTFVFMLTGLIQLVFAAWISFGRKMLLKNSAVLLVITMVFSGVFQMFPGGNAGLYCVAGCILVPLIKRGSEAFFRAKQTQSALYKVVLSHQGEEQKFIALMDTGNRLRLPGSGMPVILADEVCLKKWMEQAREQCPEKLVFIPYKGVGGTGLLYGVRVRCGLYREEGGKKERGRREGRQAEVNETEGEVAAVAAEHRLFVGCEYRIILQPEVLRLSAAKENNKEGCLPVFGGKE